MLSSVELSFIKLNKSMSFSDVGAQITDALVNRPYLPSHMPSMRHVCLYAHWKFHLETPQK